MLISFFVHCTGHEVRSASLAIFKMNGTNLWLGCTTDNPLAFQFARRFPNIFNRPRRAYLVARKHSDSLYRLMSDYEVTLVNDNSKFRPLDSYGSIR